MEEDLMLFTEVAIVLATEDVNLARGLAEGSLLQADESELSYRPRDEE